VTVRVCSRSEEETKGGSYFPPPIHFKLTVREDSKERDSLIGFSNKDEPLDLGVRQRKGLNPLWQMMMMVMGVI